MFLQKARHPIAPLQVHRVAQGVTLLVWEGEPAARGQKMRPLINEAAATPLMSSTSVSVGSFRVRHLLALRTSDRNAQHASFQVADSSGRVLAADTADAERNDRWAVDFDVSAVLSGLDTAGRVRVARFLLDVCPGLFPIAGAPEFRAICRRMASQLGRTPPTLVPVCEVFGRYVLCEGMAPAGLGDRLTGVVIGPSALTRPVFAPAVSRSAPRRGGLRPMLLLLEGDRDPSPSTAVIFGEGGLICRRVVADPGRVPNVLAWLQEAPDSKTLARRYLLDCLATLSGDDAQAAALARELRILVRPPANAINDPSHPLAAGADAIVGTAAGVFVSGWLKDPHDLVEAIELRRGGRSHRLSAQSLFRFPGPSRDDRNGREGTAAPESREGFAAFFPSSGNTDAPCRLVVALKSGIALDVAEGPPAGPARDARERPCWRRSRPNT